MDVAFPCQRNHVNNTKFSKENFICELVKISFFVLDYGALNIKTENTLKDCKVVLLVGTSSYYVAMQVHLSLNRKLGQPDLISVFLGQAESMNSD